MVPSKYMSSKCPFLCFSFCLFCSSTTSSSFSSPLLFLCGSKDWAQGLVYVRQTLYQLDYNPSHFIIYSTRICWILTVYQILCWVLGIWICISQKPLSCWSLYEVGIVSIVNLIEYAIIWKIDPYVCPWGIFLVELVEVRRHAHCGGTIPCWGAWTSASGEWVLSCTMLLSLTVFWLWLWLQVPVPLISPPQ